MDYESGKHRGFAFVEFDDPEDAEEALFNMDGAELLGRFIKVSVANPNQIHKLTSNSTSSGAIWQSDEWFQQNSGVSDETQRSKHADVQALTNL